MPMLAFFVTVTCVLCSPLMQPFAATCNASLCRLIGERAYGRILPPIGVPDVWTQHASVRMRNGPVSQGYPTLEKYHFLATHHM